MKLLIFSQLLWIYRDQLMKLFLLIFLIFLSGCNVCSDEIRPIIYIKNFNNPKEERTSSLMKLNSDGNILLKYKYNNSEYDNRNYNTVVYFEESHNRIKPNYIYKFQYDNDVYFIYDINIPNSSYHSACFLDITYKINECHNTGFEININPSCAIPADQANEYFETKIKPYYK
ncbi:hypothetical protein [Psychrobacter sp. I-STPA6b]|uniref:hypothetical protein n=1 Tax=Psychrobacter sp. I-STPA6b TaxID=2585718 RepID=UPI001D0C2578|nr:hypothetical protein [Psychrobacter sp. I-STPA6b]